MIKNQGKYRHMKTFSLFYNNDLTLLNFCGLSKKNNFWRTIKCIYGLSSVCMQQPNGGTTSNEKTGSSAIDNLQNLLASSFITQFILSCILSHTHARTNTLV